MQSTLAIACIAVVASASTGVKTTIDFGNLKQAATCGIVALKAGNDCKKVAATAEAREKKIANIKAPVLKEKLAKIATESRKCLNTIEADRAKCHKKVTGATALAAGLSMAALVYLF